ncbi:putative GTP-binding protein [Escherichia coli]|uniref:Putative GTP-binding protein n=1 Tax=Escherichia coli TaxID=562 RepID=A0A3S4MAQ3_ECOLX|nr:putative GTP-binding protein [Escherichia coli]
MNKSLVAVGVIVALGVVWTGGAWYTGKKIENPSRRHGRAGERATQTDRS